MIVASAAAKSKGFERVPIEITLPLGGRVLARFQPMVVLRPGHGSPRLTAHQWAARSTARPTDMGVRMAASWSWVMVLTEAGKGCSRQWDVRPLDKSQGLIQLDIAAMEFAF